MVLNKTRCFSNHFRLPEYRGTFPENQTAQLRGGEKEQVAKAPRTFTYSRVLKAQETHNHFSPAWWALGKVNHVRMTRKWPSKWGQECAFDAWVKNVPLAKGQDRLAPGFLVLAGYVCSDSHPTFQGQKLCLFISLATSHFTGLRALWRGLWGN